MALPEQRPAPSAAPSAASPRDGRLAAAGVAYGATTGTIDLGRYRRVQRFFASVILHYLIWDVVASRPGLRRLRRPPLERWAAIAERYRALAVELGGVLIKLGQFLSARVDLLPPEITDTLAGLQDEVPPVSFAAIAGVVEADLGAPLDELFASFEELPMGSASLAQVHQARLHDGETVVVKALRPGITTVVETDLAALRFAVRWLRRFENIRRRVNLDALVDEFTATTRAELDLVAEARHLEHFREMFADDPQVQAPRAFPERSGRSTLTLENVAFIKVIDRAALEAAGISPNAVARALYRVYLEQVLVHNFVHADPHPGNLFVRPAPGLSTGAGGGTGFVLVFVDFGMVARVPPRLRAAAREFAIGFGTRDAGRMVRAYVAAGTLLPGADLDRLEQAHRELLDRFWGIPLGDLRDVALAQAPRLLLDYRDLILSAPFQVQVDLLFVLRALGLLSGLATSLDPRFDPWKECIEFAARLAKEEPREGEERVTGGFWDEGLAAARELAAALVRLPTEIHDFLGRAGRGDLLVRARFEGETQRSIERLAAAVTRLGWFVLAVGLLIGGTMLFGGAAGGPLAPILLALAAVVFVWGLRPRG